MFKGEGSELHLFQLSHDSHHMMTKSSKLLQDVQGFHSDEVNLQRGLDWVPNKSFADHTITDDKKRP